MARTKTDLTDMDLGELIDELRATKQEALNLRFRNATGQLDNTAEITKSRRRIARINTLIRHVVHQPATLYSFPKRPGISQVSSPDLHTIQLANLRRIAY